MPRSGKVQAVQPPDNRRTPRLQPWECVRWFDKAAGEPAAYRSAHRDPGGAVVPRTVQAAADEKPHFTEDEIRYIESRVGGLLSRWFDYLIRHVVSAARAEGVQLLYWNSSETVHGTETGTKKEFFYERLPKQLGFQEVRANLRGRGNERLWLLDLGGRKTASSAPAGMVALDKIKPQYQGAFISITRHRGPYTAEEVEAVKAAIVKSRKKGQGDWGKVDPEQLVSHQKLKRTWEGAQRFRDDRKEMVFAQKMSSDLLGKAENDPTMMKLVSFLLKTQHFGDDILGWCLVSPVDGRTWLVNQVQTDTVNLYKDIRDRVMGGDDSERAPREVDEQTVVDMLTAQGKSEWIPFFRENPQYMEAVRSRPGDIGGLATNEELAKAGGVRAWLGQQRGALGAFGNLGAHGGADAGG